MADLNELIKSAKKLQSAKPGPDDSGSLGNPPSRTAFNGEKGAQAPKEVHPTATPTLVQSPSVQVLRPGFKQGTVRVPGGNPKSIPAEEMDALQQIVDKPKPAKKGRSRKSRFDTPQIDQLRIQCKAMMDNNQAEGMVVSRLASDTRTILSLFSKASGIPSQYLASVIIQNYFDENYADFVRKVRDMGF